MSKGLGRDHATGLAPPAQVGKSSPMRSAGIAASRARAERRERQA